MTLVNFPDEIHALNPEIAGRYESLFQQAAVKSGLAKRLASLPHAVQLLRAISLHENPNQDPSITRENRNGTVDHGLMQVNDIHWNKGDKMYDPMTNIMKGADVLTWALNRSHDDIPAALSIYNRGHYGQRDQRGEFHNQGYVDSVRAIFSKLMAPTVDKLAQASSQAKLGPNLTAASVGPQ